MVQWAKDWRVSSPATRGIIADDFITVAVGVSRPYVAVGGAAGVHAAVLQNYPRTARTCSRATCTCQSGPPPARAHHGCQFDGPNEHLEVPAVLGP